MRVRYSTNYYPQGNGLDKYTNKNLLNILRKTISTHHQNWHTALHGVLWEDIVTPKYSIANSPFCLVYDTEAILPHIFLPFL